MPVVFCQGYLNDTNKDISINSWSMLAAPQKAQFVPQRACSCLVNYHKWEIRKGTSVQLPTLSLNNYIRSEYQNHFFQIVFAQNELYNAILAFKQHSARSQMQWSDSGSVTVKSCFTLSTMFNLWKVPQWTWIWCWLMEKKTFYFRVIK